MASVNEPTFTIKIQACSFKNLTMEQLIAKLQLMHKMSFKTFYTIVEEIPEEKKDDMDKKILSSKILVF